MQFFKKSILRIVWAVLIMVILYAACNFFLLKIEGGSYITMKDLGKEKDLNIVVVGNSEASRHFDPFLFQEKTDKNSFNLSRSASTVMTQYIMIEEMFDHHQPEKVFVFFDPYKLGTIEESPIIQASMWPFLSNPIRRTEYALALAEGDGAYMDRLFPWRLYMPESPGEFVSNLKNKVNILSGSTDYYEHAVDISDYVGKGYAPRSNDRATTMEIINKSCKFKPTKNEINIHEKVQEQILQIDELCRRNNCELIAVNIPRLPSVVISSCLNYYDAEAKFFAEHGITFWNFCYAKEELMPQMDVSYYFDVSHMVAAGAEIFTEALARVYNAYENGEDVTGLFYTTDEYLATVDYITNTWFKENNIGEHIQLTAYANHGTNVVPEYCFVKIDENGSEVILQDYSQKNVLETKLEKGEKIRLYARNISAPEQSPLSFEFE